MEGRDPLEVSAFSFGVLFVICCCYLLHMLPVKFVPVFGGGVWFCPGKEGQLQGPYALESSGDYVGSDATHP